jgi:hypothetical protein
MITREVAEEKGKLGRRNEVGKQEQKQGGKKTSKKSS